MNMNRSSSNNNNYYFSSPTFMNSQGNPLFGSSGYAPMSSATEAPLVPNYFSAQCGSTPAERQKSRTSVTSEEFSSNPQMSKSNKPKTTNNNKISPNNHMNFKTQIPAFYPGQPLIYNYPYPQPHAFSINDYLHMDTTQPNVIPPTSESNYNHPFGFVPVQAAPPLNWKPPTRRSIGYSGNAYLHHQSTQNGEIYPMYANPYMPPEGHAMFMNELKERAFKESKRKKTLEEDLKEPPLSQDRLINNNDFSQIEYDGENAEGNAEDVDLQVVYPEELFGVDHVYDPKTKFFQSDSEPKSNIHYSNPSENQFHTEQPPPPQHKKQAAVDEYTFVANPFVPTPSNMNDLFHPIFNNTYRCETPVRDGQEAKDEYQEYTSKVAFSNRKSISKHDPMFSVINRQEQFKPNKIHESFALDDDISKRGKHHKRVSSFRNMDHIFDGTIQPQELIISEQLLSKNDIDEINDIDYNKNNKGLDENLKFEDCDVFGEAKTGFKGNDLDVDLDIDVEYELPYINQSAYSALPSALFESSQTAGIDQINSMLIEEKKTINKRSTKKESTLYEKNKPKKVKIFERENRPTPILLDNSDVNRDIIYKDVLESSVMKSIESENEPTVAPQYLEDNSTLDSYSVLTKSTIQAVEQIKNDVMNNKNGKLMFFSPAVESQDKQPKSTVNTSTFNRLANFNISSPMSNNSIDSGLMTGPLKSSNHTGKHRILSQINETPLTSVYESYGEGKNPQLPSSSTGFGKPPSFGVSAKKTPSSNSKSSSVTKALTATVDAVLKKNMTLPDSVKKKKVSSNLGRSSTMSSPKAQVTKKKVKKPTSAETGNPLTSLVCAPISNYNAKLEATADRKLTKTSALAKTNPIISRKVGHEGVGYNEITTENNLKENEILETLKDIFLNKGKTTRNSAASKQKGVSTLVFQSSNNQASDVELKSESHKTDKQKLGVWGLSADDEEYLEGGDLKMEDDQNTESLYLTGATTPNESSLVSRMLNDKILENEDLKKPKRGFYKCLHCNETYSTVLDYAKHLDEAKIVRPFKCPFHTCLWKYLGLTKRSELRRHCAIQHKEELTTEMMELLNLNNDNFPVLHCQNKFCDKKFYRRDSHQRHVQMVHMNPRSRFNKRVEKFRKQCPLTNEKEIDEFIRARLAK
ncbi:hypothetical protein ACO0QE_003393 [Hanseniaspora vineae]